MFKRFKKYEKWKDVMVYMVRFYKFSLWLPIIICSNHYLVLQLKYGVYEE